MDQSGQKQPGNCPPTKTSGIKFRFVHDLSEHLTLLEQADIKLPEEVKAAAILTDYSVEARYPGPYEPVTEVEFLDSLAIAEAVVSWAEKLIQSP